MTRSSIVEPNLKSVTRKYVFWFLLFFVAINLVFYAHFYWRQLRPAEGASHGIPSRLAYYAEHRNDFNLVFLGDSRTYCGIHSELIDPLLGTHSINLSTFAHWFPTQLAMVKDFAPMVPPGTTVVWSIGHQNFDKLPIRTAYPISLALAKDYVLWGGSQPGLASNLMTFNPFLSFVGRREELNAYQLQPILDRKVWAGRHAGPVQDTGGLVERAGQLKSEWAKNPQVEKVDILYDNGKPTSLAVHFMRGGHYRIELDPGFFRMKQQEHKRELEEGGEPPPLAMDAGLKTIFLQILETFRERGIRLVVNEFEEAPFMYETAANREKYRAYMRTQVAPLVRQYGFAYITTDLDRLDDTDYFDYNHLNSKGIAKYLPMLATQLKPHLNK